jgi:hypothetical protein
VECLATFVVTGLRVRVAVDDLQSPPDILELHLYVLLLLWVDFLLALPLTGRCAILLRVLLHLLTELFRELFDLPALRHAMARGVVHRTLRADGGVYRLLGPHLPLQ